MPMFPSVLDTFSYPTASSRLNSPSHSAQHTNINSIVGQIEAVIGLADSSSTLGTLIGDLRSPGSNGGGHVQTANKGGTGQTVYAKGDILVGQSSSVLSKLSLGNDGAVLQADSTQPTGTKWGSVVAVKIASSVATASVAGSQVVAGTSVLTTFYSASILGSTLGTSNAIRFTGEIVNLIINNNNNDRFNINVNYGNNVIASVAVTNIFSPNGNNNPMRGILRGIIVGAGTTNKQQAALELTLSTIQNSIYPSVFSYYSGGTSSVDSTSQQNLVINVGMSSVLGVDSVMGGLFLLEKIQ